MCGLGEKEEIHAVGLPIARWENRRLVTLCSDINWDTINFLQSGLYCAVF